MIQDYLHILNPVISLVINVIFQVLGFRYLNLGLLKSEYLGFTIGFLSIFIFEFYISFLSSVSGKDFIAFLITNSLIYSALGYCYFHFINLGETARRIRILRDIYDSKYGLSMNEILERYNAKEIVEKRINRLLNNGQIIYKDGRYYIGSPTMVLISKTIVAMKLILLGKSSEFK